MIAKVNQESLAQRDQARVAAALKNPALHAAVEAGDVALDELVSLAASGVDVADWDWQRVLALRRALVGSLDQLIKLPVPVLRLVTLPSMVSSAFDWAGAASHLHYRDLVETPVNRLCAFIRFGSRLQWHAVLRQHLRLEQVRNWTAEQFAVFDTLSHHGSHEEVGVWIALANRGRMDTVVDATIASALSSSSSNGVLSDGAQMDGLDVMMSNCD